MTDPHTYDVDMMIEEALEDVVDPCVNAPFVPPCINMDVTHLFTIEQVFPTRDDLVNWARNVGKVNGFVLVIARSDNGQTGYLAFVSLMCERHGVYKPYKDPTEFKCRKRSTKKCDCHFRLKGRLIKDLGGWMVKVKNGQHNHEANQNLVGHSYAGRLTKEESQVESMANNWVAPRHMLNHLKQKNPENKSTITQVYTACKTLRRDKRGARTEMQDLMKMMQDGGYVHYERTEEDSEVLRDLF